MASIINSTTTNGVTVQGDNSGSLQLATNNGTTAVTIDTSQNVGILNTSPSSLASNADNLVIGSGSGDFGLTIYGDTSSDGTINFADGTGTPNRGIIQYKHASDALLFGTAATERMRITSTGAVCIGTTAPISSGFTTISYNGTALNGLILNESSSASGSTFLAFNLGVTNIGNVSRVGATSAVVYNTTSDQRLKSNIADANPVLDKLMDVKVRQFDWTEGDLHQDAGFIAQELAPVLSGIVTQGKTEEDMWQMDYARLTPYLVKAIQELKAELDATKAEVQALKGVK